MLGGEASRHPGAIEETESLHHRFLHTKNERNGFQPDLDHTKTTKALRLKVGNLEDENEELRMSVSSARYDLEVKDLRLGELTQKIETLTNDLISSNSEVQKVTRLYKEMEERFGSELRRCQDQLKDARNDAAQAHERLLELQKDRDALKHQIQQPDTQADSDKLEALTASLASENESLKQENEALQRQNKEMLEKLEEITFDKQEKESLLEKINILNSTIEAIQDGNNDFEQLLDEAELLRKENAELRGIIEKENEEEECQSLSEGEVPTTILNTQNEEEEDLELARISSENDNLRDEISRLQAENDELQTHLDQMVAMQCHSMIDQLEGVRVTNQDLRQRSFDFGALAEENAILKHRIFGLESQNQEFQRLISTGQGGNQMVATLMKENCELKQQMEKLSKTIDPSSSLKRVQEVTQGLRSLENSDSSGGEEDGELTEEQAAFVKRENQTLKKIIDAFDPAMQNLELAQKLQELERSCAEAEERVRTLEHSNEQMAEWLSGNRTRQDELVERYMTENEILKATVTDLQRQLNLHNERDLYTETALADQRIKELEEEVKRLKTFDDDVVDNLQEQVEYLQSNVDTLMEDKERLEKIVLEQEKMIRDLEGDKIRAAQMHLDSLQKDLTIHEQREQISEMTNKLHEFQAETTLMQQKVDKVIHAFEESQENYIRMQAQIETVQAQLNSTLEENTQLKRELADQS